MQWNAEWALKGNSYISVIRAASHSRARLKMDASTCTFLTGPKWWLLALAPLRASQTFYCSRLKSTSLHDCCLLFLTWLTLFFASLKVIHDALPNLSSAVFSHVSGSARFASYLGTNFSQLPSDRIPLKDLWSGLIIQAVQQWNRTGLKPWT